MARPQRMFANSPSTNSLAGAVVWSPVKSVWFSTMAALGVVGGAWTATWDAVGVCLLLTAATLCCGHSVGLHRLLIHRSFACPLWLEYTLVYLGVLVGMGGPRRMMYMHEIRDWSQNQPRCHPFFIHGSGMALDGIWNLHCECRLDDGPTFTPESRVTRSEFYRLLDRYWLAAQLPVALVLFLIGGWSWVLWGVCFRVALSLTGHWLVGYFAHNCGQLKWRIEGASVQGRNIGWLGLITMGESFHNNHHAFPDSARLGIEPGQLDPGWWLVSALRRVGLAEEVTVPDDLAPKGVMVRSPRPERWPNLVWKARHRAH